MKYNAGAVGTTLPFNQLHQKHPNRHGWEELERISRTSSSSYSTFQHTVSQSVSPPCSNCHGSDHERVGDSLLICFDFFSSSLSFPFATKRTNQLDERAKEDVHPLNFNRSVGACLLMSDCGIVETNTPRTPTPVIKVAIISHTYMYIHPEVITPVYRTVVSRTGRK